MYKTEIRKTCKICGRLITKNRFRTYCSLQCRNYFHNQKNRQYQKEWGINKRGEYAIDKIQCQICGKWYRQVGSHIWGMHKMTAREYREEYGFDVKKGQLPDDLRKLKAEQAIECGGVKNLKKGKKYRFKKGSLKAGKYPRSEQTLERLKNLYKFRNKK